MDNLLLLFGTVGPCLASSVIQLLSLIHPLDSLKAAQDNFMESFLGPFGVQVVHPSSLPRSMVASFGYQDWDPRHNPFLAPVHVFGPIGRLDILMLSQTALYMGLGSIFVTTLRNMGLWPTCSSRSCLTSGDDARPESRSFLCSLCLWQLDLLLSPRYRVLLLNGGGIQAKLHPFLLHWLDVSCRRRSGSLLPALLASFLWLESQVWDSHMMLGLITADLLGPIGVIPGQQVGQGVPTLLYHADSSTPGSAEPPPKKSSSLVDGLAYSWVAGSVSVPKTKSPSHTLWIHTHDVEKGPIDKDIFFEIVSRCNVIKVKGTIIGEAEFSWNNDLNRQPTYDSDHLRGKIVCGNLQTVDFWCKYIPIAALEVSDTSCKAWTWEEYEIPKIRYSFLIPFDTCNGLEATDLIHATLINNNLSMSDVLTCRTSYAKLSHQRICNIEVTDQLSKAIDDAGRFLQGPVCSLTFKLQSGNTGDPELETVCLEIDQPMDDTQLLESGSTGGSILEGDASSQCLNSSSETVVPPNSPTSSVHSSISTSSLSSKVKHLVVTPDGDPPT